MRCNLEAAFRELAVQRRLNEIMTIGRNRRDYETRYCGGLDVLAAMLVIDRVDVRIIARNIIDLADKQGTTVRDVVFPAGWLGKQIVAAQAECKRLDAVRREPYPGEAAS